MKKILGIFFLSLCAISVYCRTNFRPGFIITNEMDTVYGKVNYRNDRLMCKYCTFKTEKSDKKKYYPGEIIGYRFENDRYFETTNVDGKPKFLEILIKGEVSIYYFCDENRSIYFFKKGDSTLTELNYFERIVHINEYGNASDGNNYIIEKNDTSYSKIYTSGDYFVKSQEFKTILNNSLQDEPEIIDEIKNLKKPGHDGLINIAKKYHELKKSNQKIVVYND